MSGIQERNTKTCKKTDVTVYEDGTVHNQPVLITSSATSAEKQTGGAEMAAVSKGIEKLIEEINE
jgi:hypothetical protein